MPGHEREEDRVDDREGGTVVSASVGGEHREHHKDAHLDEDEGAGPSVVPPMQFDVQRAIDPGDPDDREDDRELREPADRQVLGEMVGCLADDRDVDEVVEELEEADVAVLDDVAVRAWRTPQPLFEASLRLDRHSRQRSRRGYGRDIDRASGLPPAGADLQLIGAKQLQAATADPCERPFALQLAQDPPGHLPCRPDEAREVGPRQDGRLGTLSRRPASAPRSSGVGSAGDSARSVTAATSSAPTSQTATSRKAVSCDRATVVGAPPPPPPKPGPRRGRRQRR